MPLQQPQPGFQVPLVLRFCIGRQGLVAFKASQKRISDLVTMPIPQPPDIEELLQPVTLQTTDPMGGCNASAP